MKVTVRLGEPIWRAVGRRRVEVEVPGRSCTLSEVVERLQAAYPSLGSELRGEVGGSGTDGGAGHFTLFRGDRLVHPADVLYEQVADGEEIMLMMPMAGG
jgi:hypothetical protein